MSLIVKIMSAQRGNDGHPRHGHRIFAEVREVEFQEPTEHRPPTVHLTYRRATDASPEETNSVALFGNAYVMNEAGRTISSFEVCNPPVSERDLDTVTVDGRTVGLPSGPYTGREIYDALGVQPGRVLFRVPTVEEVTAGGSSDPRPMAPDARFMVVDGTAYVTEPAAQFAS
jgi:hypothetical protein